MTQPTNATATRREFLKRSALLGAGVTLGAPLAWADEPADERLRIGVVGVAGRGAANLGGVAGENIVALCDIDDRHLLAAGERFRGAALYSDYRRMVEREKLDAVVVSTPDHTHAPAAMAALSLGMHVYCEKPLTHSVFEARQLAETAAKANLVTQMGTQIHAEDNYRRVVEAIGSGAIGQVKAVHVFCGKGWWASQLPRGAHRVPPYLHYDLWQGPAPARPYHPDLLPANWRRYWDYGGGTLADMACHYTDLPFWALGLRHPTTIEAEGPEPHPHCAPEWLIVRYRFPTSFGGAGGPVDLSWYDGGRRPELLEEIGAADWGNGVLFVGDKGQLVADYGRFVLLPRDRFEGWQAPAHSIPKSIGHHAEWIRACKEGTPTTCNFDYSGALTEAVLLGAVAFRSGKKLEWDAAKLEATNAPEVAELIRPGYRTGW